MKLNLGCGDRYADGWHNVDLPDMPHRADDRLDLREELPNWLTDVTDVYAGHVFEHLTPEEGETFLMRLLERMSRGGQLMIVGPDIDVAKEIVNSGGEMWGETLHSLEFGAGRWTGDVHLWGWTSSQQTKVVKRAGWRNITQLQIDDVPSWWPVAVRAPQWQRAVHAVAP